MTTEYGASYFGVRNRTHAETDLDRFEDAGLNAVLHTFSERDHRYYEETMQDIVAESKHRELEVYVNPWSVGGVFGGEALSQFIGEHPDAQQISSEDNRVAAACFNAPEFREYMRDWTRSAAGLGADVLFWDEPHWFLPEWLETEFADDEWGCRCEHCQARYEDTYGEPMPSEATERVHEFKADQLMDFLTEMMALTREEGCENAVCLLPSEDAEHGLSDWEQLAANEYLDVLVTDPYWGVFPEAEGPEEFVGYFSEKVAGMADEYDLRGQIWIQGFRLPAGSTEEVTTATRTALESGVDSVMLWGYDGCKSISEIACEEPEDVWNRFLEEVQAAQQ